MAIKTTPNTLSVGTQVHNANIMAAKAFLKKEYGNKYDAEPHFNFIIMAFPDYRVHDIEDRLDNYLKKLKPLKLKLGTLRYEEKQQFYSIPIVGEEAMTFHKELIAILNPIRDGYIREKDLVRITEGKTDALEEEYIYKYGYLRVLDKFTPHITLGNIQTAEADQDDIQNKLTDFLGTLYGSELTIDEIRADFILDADVQSNYKRLWTKIYNLA
jgi:hypothetical protein